jgi:hypothetical protein
MSVKAQAAVSPAQSYPIFHRIWLLAGMAIGLIATVAWSGFLGYGLFRLAF